MNQLILKDLKQHFGEELRHNSLCSCLFYDVIFAQLVIGPIFVSCWRGTWQNADTLFDEILCLGNLDMAAAISYALGFVVSFVILISQHEIHQLLNNTNR